MIKSIVKFITGEVIKTNQTCKTVYLSDGTHWNNNKFHEYCALIRAFIYRETQQSEEIKLIQAEIDKAKLAIIDKMSSASYFYSRINQRLEYGKYKGMLVSEVVKTDIQYLNWYFDKMPQDFKV